MIINYIIIIVIKNGDFLTEDIIKSFNNKEEAEILLEKSRNRIDEIDNELMDLISQRTSLANVCLLNNDYFSITNYDESRVNHIHKKIRKLSEEKGLDADIIDQIIDMLTKLSKIEQNKILRRNVDGKY